MWGGVRDVTIQRTSAMRLEDRVTVNIFCGSGIIQPSLQSDVRSLI